MAYPIFVFDTQRSGTSWLANQLSQHPLIASVTVPVNNPYNLNPGIYESCFFSYLYGRYGDISHKPSYIEFWEVLSATDYFQIIGVEKKNSMNYGLLNMKAFIAI